MHSKFEDEDDKEYWADEHRKKLTKLVQDIIRDACEVETGKNFKKKVPLIQLLDEHLKKSDYYKDRENAQFKKYLVVIDDIVTDINLLFPFIDVTGIDLGWTAQQVIDKVFEIYDAIPIQKLKVE